MKSPRLPSFSAPLLFFLVSRVWVALFVYLGHSQHRYLAAQAGGWAGVANWWLNPWTAFDSQWFLDIARSGYQPATIAFFPFYPFLLHLAGPNLIHMAVLGVFLSHAAFALALVLLHRLTSLDYDERIATLAVASLAFFPSAALFGAVYTESTFLVLLVTCFLCVRRRRWGWAGVLALLAALTRNSGPVIFVALLLEWLRQRKDDPDQDDPDQAPKSALLAVALPMMAFMAVQFYHATHFGGALAGVRSQEAYYRAVSPPWIPLWRDLADVITLRHYDLTTLLNLIVAFGAFALVWIHRKRQPASYGVLMAGIMLMHLTYARTIPPYTIGAVRYMATTFPFVQLLAIHARPLTANRFRLVLSAAIYLMLCAVMSYLFGAKSFVN